MSDRAVGDVPQPLAGVRVVELARVLAGPWAGQLLADLGADVVKVERPGTGDDTRAWGPPWHGDGAHRQSAYFQSANRNKRSVAVDLKHPEGAALVRRLIAGADVVIENFKPGSLARCGLDAGSLREEHPGLVWCTITGFGLDGPLSARPGYDLLVQAMGGLMSLTGPADGPPHKTGVAIADLMTGMYASSAILAALRRRDATGRGTHLDLSLLDTQLAWLANQGLNHLVSGTPPRRRGNAHPNIVPYEVFEAADGEVVVAVGNDRQFAALAAVLGEPGWASDPRFATSAARVAHRDVLVPVLQARLATRSRAHWEAALVAVGVPCGPVHDVGEALSQPQAQHRGAVVTQAGPAGPVQTLASPIRVAPDGGDDPLVAYRTAPPDLGADRDAVLEGWLGLDEDGIAGLAERGAFGDGA